MAGPGFANLESHPHPPAGDALSGLWPSAGLGMEVIAAGWARKVLLKRETGMDTRDDSKLEELILRELSSQTSKEAILIPAMFKPPIMLSNIFRIALKLKAKGFTSAPDRRLGGWHLKLLGPGIDHLQNKT
jgi:hypothetical protein